MTRLPALAAATAILGALLVAVPGSAAPVCAPSGSAINVAGQAYVQYGAGVHLWLEANEIPGLQKAACSQGGLMQPPDQYVSEVPPELLGLCLGGGSVPTLCL